VSRYDNNNNNNNNNNQFDEIVSVNEQFCSSGFSITTTEQHSTSIGRALNVDATGTSMHAAVCFNSCSDPRARQKHLLNCSTPYPLPVGSNQFELAV
jgi:hypothetical protein